MITICLFLLLFTQAFTHTRRYALTLSDSCRQYFDEFRGKNWLLVKVRPSRAGRQLAGWVGGRDWLEQAAKSSSADGRGGGRGLRARSHSSSSTTRADDRGLKSSQRRRLNVRTRPPLKASKPAPLAGSRFIIRLRPFAVAASVRARRP